MRLIDADALKELFSEVIGHIAIKPEMNGNLEHMIRASAMVIQMIDDAPTVNALNCSEIPNNWIPCSERLPEEYGEYLVAKHTIGWNCEEYDVNDIAYFDGDGFHKADRVIAWMPLPEPYQEGGEADE